MKIKCKHCNNTSDSNDWDKTTKRQCGEGITDIEQGINNNNWYYICPLCEQICYKNDRENITK